MQEHDKDGGSSKHPYVLPDPYPTPRVVRTNHRYAFLLLEDYAGVSGELSAINQYIYQYITLQAHHLDIADLLRQVGIVEMRHLALLGETIQLLGVPPLLHSIDENGFICFWNAKYIYYGQCLYDQLSADIDHEARRFATTRNASATY